MRDPCTTLHVVLELLVSNQIELASAYLRKYYPFETHQNIGRRYTPYQSMCVFLRDGFIDRYSGTRLVNPATLRLISALLPREFPAHPNWKQSETHIGFWELFPTIDHVVPIARGGPDEESNWVTTSMLRNAAKGNALVDEIGFHLVPAGSYEEWDGFTHFVIEYAKSHPGLEDLPEGSRRHRTYILQWVRASERALKSTLEKS